MRGKNGKGKGKGKENGGEEWKVRRDPRLSNCDCALERMIENSAVFACATCVHYRHFRGPGHLRCRSTDLLLTMTNSLSLYVVTCA